MRSDELARLVDEGVIDVDCIMAERRDVRHVYVVESAGLYKIGYATDPKRRISSMNCGSASKVRLVWSMPTEEYIHLEAVLHTKFEHKHHHGEWFALDDVDLHLIKAFERLPVLLSLPTHRR